MRKILFYHLGESYGAASGAKRRAYGKTLGLLGPNPRQRNARWTGDFGLYQRT